MFTPKDLSGAGLMILVCEAKSEAARQLVDDWTQNFILTGLPEGQQIRPSSVRKYQMVLGALLADLIKLDRKGLCGAHGMAKSDFPKGRGFGHSVFVTVKDALIRNDLLQQYEGTQQFNNFENLYTGAPVTISSSGWVSRFRLSERALEAMAEVLGPDGEWNKHWQRRVFRGPTNLSKEPAVTLRAKAVGPSYNRTKGRRMLADPTDPKVVAMTAEIEEHNQFLLTRGVSGFAFEGLRRHFLNGDQDGFDWQYHGRFYAKRKTQGAERMTPSDRLQHIVLADQKVGEVDLRASQLTLLCALTGSKLIAGNDPYKIKGLDRELVKHWLTKTLGRGDAEGKRWTKKAKEYYLGIKPDGDLSNDHIFSSYSKAILSHYPILDQLGSKGVPGVLELQFIESEIIRGAMAKLRHQDIPSLPVHDSLIVTIGAMQAAEEALKDAFLECVKLVSGKASTIIPSIKHSVDLQGD